jgi:hypothetical protein
LGTTTASANRIAAQQQAGGVAPGLALGRLRALDDRRPHTVGQRVGDRVLDHRVAVVDQLADVAAQIEGVDPLGEAGRDGVGIGGVVQRHQAAWNRRAKLRL